MNTTNNTTSTSNAQLKTLYIITLERQDDEEVEEEEKEESKPCPSQKKTRKFPRTVANLKRKTKKKRRKSKCICYHFITEPKSRNNSIIYVCKANFIC